MIKSAPPLPPLRPDGVPHAGLWLNDTFNGTAGTFIPLGDPAVNGSRVYIMAAFRPHPLESADGPLLTRLYAIDIRTTISQRIDIVWQLDIFLRNSYIPYLSASRTFCSSSPAARSQPPSHYDTSTRSPSRVMTQARIVVASVNLCDSPACTPTLYASRLLRVEDLGSSYRILSDDNLSGDIAALAWHEDIETAGDMDSTERRNRDWKEPFSKEIQMQSNPLFWLLSSGNHGAQLQERQTTDGYVTRQVILETLLGVKQVNTTTEMSLVYGSQTSIALVGVSCTPTETESGYLSLVSSPLHYVLALDISGDQTIQLLWQLPLPPKEPAVGQIATAGLGSTNGSIIVVTTPLAVYAYRLQMT